MNNHIRPVSLRNDGLSSWAKNIVNAVNSHNLIAGDNVDFSRGSSHTAISVDLGPEIEHLVWRGDFDINAEYKVNDVVRVNPNKTYYDSGSATTLSIDSSAIAGYTNCPICAGLFVCVNYVPPVWANENYLVTVGTQFTTIPYEIANGVRYSAYNKYYPIYPEIPSSNTSSVATPYNTTIIANNTFWQALSPMIKMQTCTGNSTTIAYVNAIVSGSSFNSSYLSYTH